jgi:hypothetical protein
MTIAATPFQIKLKHDYEQFNGKFFIWLYVSLGEVYVPQIFEFTRPDGSKILASTEVIYRDTAKLEEHGIEALRGTRTVQLLAGAYQAPDLKMPSQYRQDFLLKHAIGYYTDCKIRFIKASENPFEKRDIRAVTIEGDGIIKILLLSKIDNEKTEEELDL